LYEIFETFLDIVNQIISEDTKKEYGILLGSKITAKDLAEIFDEFLVESSVKPIETEPNKV
jgi:hypothetical protein